MRGRLIRAPEKQGSERAGVTLPRRGGAAGEQPEIARHVRLIAVAARRGRILAIIEVKSRDTVDAAAEAISLRQRGRIIAAARLYLGRNPRHADCSVRFDVMLVIPGRWPHHIASAWQLDELL